MTDIGQCSAVEAQHSRTQDSGGSRAGSGFPSQLCIAGFPRNQRSGAKSALLELDGEEGNVGWIGMWMSCTFRDGIGVMSNRTKHRRVGGSHR